METFGAILALCDIVIMAWALHKLYHGMFTVIYFGLEAYVKELLITLILAGIIVSAGLKVLGLDVTGDETLGLGGFLYLGGFFAVSVFLIVRFNKPKKN